MVYGDLDDLKVCGRSVANAKMRCQAEYGMTGDVSSNAMGPFSGLSLLPLGHPKSNPTEWVNPY